MEWQEYLNVLKGQGAIGGLIGSGSNMIGDLTKQEISFPTDAKDTETPTKDAVSAPDRPAFNTAPTDLPTIDTTLWEDTDKGQMALGAYEDAKGDLYKYEGYEYTDYTESEDVKNAGNALDQHNSNKPGDYTSQWKQQIDSLMKRIMGREKFSYNMNEDALYQQHKDNYIRQGKLAMADTMGQTAAMTGGYGSSWAQSVGQQAYQGQLDNLNDIVPELYQMALDRYTMEGQDLYNQYGLLMDRENFDYGKYRDSVADWMTNRDYLTDRYESERGFDYGQHMDKEEIKRQVKADEYNRLMDSLGIARDDYYDGADMHYAEQDRMNSESWKEYEAKESERQYGNSLLQQDYENEWAEKEWERNEERYDQEWERNEERYQDSLKYTGEDELIDDPNDITEDILSNVPASIITNLQEYTSEKGQADYLASERNKGNIDDDQIIALLDRYGTTDLVNRSWEMVSNGGSNGFGGLDNDAEVSDGTKTYTIKELYKELCKTMKPKEAKDWLKDLQTRLGI